jgi:hypothetical protein
LELTAAIDETLAAWAAGDLPDGVAAMRLLADAASGAERESSRSGVERRRSAPF